MNLPKFKINLRERQKYYLVYTGCFSITAFIIYFWFIQQHRTFIWHEDGWQQHYKALIYYSKYLRSIIKGVLVQHKLIIPNWDFTIGQGGDVLTTLHYYTIGDPISIFSVFFSEDNMYLYYDFAVLLRMFIAGIAFSALCFETEKKNFYAVLSGSMAYTFCGWAIYAKTHPFFINPMMYIPLLIMGIEKIIRKKRPYLFIVTVALSAISNFYYFYMLVLTVIIYVVIRTLLLYRKNLKDAALLIVRIGAASVLGVILSAVTFFPLCYAFLGDTRISAVSYNFHLFYPLSYYSILPQFLISSGHEYYLCMGLAMPVILAVFLMYYKKKQYTLTKTLFIICVIIILVPALGQVFNGLTYAANRWIWAFSLLCSYILVLLWPSLMDLKAKESIFLIKCSALLFIICMLFERSQNKKAFSSIAIGCILLLILIPLSDKENIINSKIKQQLTLLIVLVSVIVNARWGNSYFDNSDASIYMEVRQLVKENETDAVSEAADMQGVNEFYRYSGRELTKNANIMAGISSTEFYWSLSNPKISEYRSLVNVIENRSFDPSNYDDRAALTSLASVLYYVIPQNDSTPAPYGFTYVDIPENQSSYKVYRNEHALPLAYTYDNYMTEEAWNLLSPAEKEEAMLETAVLSEDTKYIDAKEPELSSYEIPYTITCNSNEITYKDNVFVTTNENVTATVSFDAIPNSEIYICFNGMDFKESSRYDLYYGDDKLDPLDLYNDERLDSLDINAQMGIKQEKLYWSEFEHPKTTINISTPNHENKSLHYSTKNYDFYGGRHDFAVNFISTENEPLSSINLSFYMRGVYSFDSIKIICQPMDNYVNQIENLKENTLQNVNIDTDSVTGNITLTKPGLLCFSIPYSTGWSAYVNGNETKLYNANIMHMAIELDAGTHEIQLKYRTPFLKEGILISLCGILIFFVFIFVNERRIRKNNHK